MSFDSRETYVIPGSGTTPFLLGLPSRPRFKDSRKNFQQGENRVIINFEDCSAFRGGDTKRMTINTNAQKVDIDIEYRRALLLVNESTDNIIYYGFRDNITTDISSTAGAALLPRASISIDLKNIVNVYCLTSTGSSVLSVTEIS